MTDKELFFPLVYALDDVEYSEATELNDMALDAEAFFKVLISMAVSYGLGNEKGVEVFAKSASLMMLEKMKEQNKVNVKTSPDWFVEVMK